MAGGPSHGQVDLFSDIDLQTLLDADFEAFQHQQPLHDGAIQGAGQLFSASLPAMSSMGTYSAHQFAGHPAMQQVQQHQQHAPGAQLDRASMSAVQPSTAPPTLPNFADEHKFLRSSGSGSMQPGDLAHNASFPDTAAAVMPAELTGAMLPPPQPSGAAALHHSSSTGALPHVGRQSSWAQPATPAAAMSPSNSRSDAESGGGGMQEAGSGGQEMVSAEADEIARAKDKNRVAQKKFRQRQKEKMQGWSRQCEELSSLVAKLRVEKQELQQRARILESSLAANTHHEERLHCDEDIMAREQRLLGEDLAEFMSRLEGHPTPAASAMALTMQQHVESTFPRYIGRLRQLLESAGGDQASPAGQEIDALVTMRRMHEERRALFSCFYWAAYAWNRQQLPAAGPPPGESFWSALLAGLQLGEEQRRALLAARKALLERLGKVATQRQQILGQLGLHLLQLPREEWLRCSPVLQLQRNLALERQAVFSFCFTWFDETLSPMQEAWLEANSHPWCPDIWAMSTILEQQASAAAPASQKPTSKRSGRAASKAASPPTGSSVDPGPGLALDSHGALAGLLPLNTAYQLLVAPALAHGVGLRLKRGILADPYETVVPAEAFPLPSVESLSPMTIHDVQCGRYRAEMFWNWMRRNFPDGLSIPI